MGVRKFVTEESTAILFILPTAARCVSRLYWLLSRRILRIEKSKFSFARGADASMSLLWHVTRYGSYWYLPAPTGRVPRGRLVLRKMGVGSRIGFCSIKNVAHLRPLPDSVLFYFVGVQMADLKFLISSLFSLRKQTPRISLNTQNPWFGSP